MSSTGSRPADVGVFIDLYEVLGVDRKSDTEAIRKGYKQAARRAHPDVGGSHIKFLLVALAHEVLCDPRSRAAYDQFKDLADLVSSTTEAGRARMIAASIRQIELSDAASQIPLQLQTEALGLLDLARRLAFDNTSDASRTNNQRASDEARSRQASQTGDFRGWPESTNDILSMLAEFTSGILEGWPDLRLSVSKPGPLHIRRQLLFQTSLCYHAITSIDKAVGSRYVISRTTDEVLLIYHGALLIAPEVIDSLQAVGEEVERGYSHKPRSYFERRLIIAQHELKRRGLEPLGTTKEADFAERSWPAISIGSETFAVPSNPQCPRCGAPAIVGGENCWHHSKIGRAHV